MDEVTRRLRDLDAEREKKRKGGKEGERGRKESLSLSQCPIATAECGERVCHYLLRSPPPSRIHTLSLSSCRISLSSLLPLLPFFQSHTSLQRIDLSYNRLRDEGAAALCECLAKRHPLPPLSLNLTNTQMSTKGFEAISLLVKEGRIRNLSIGYNTPLSEGILSLVSALLSPQSIVEELDLEHTELDVESISQIGKVLQQSSSLLVLNLRDNPVGVEGIRRLIAPDESSGVNETFSGLPLRGRHLHTLNISHWDLQDEGLVYLCDALAKGKIPHSLMRLSLDSNGITDCGVAAMVAVTKRRNIHWKRWGLSCNRITDDGVCGIVSLLKKEKRGDSANLIPERIREKVHLAMKENESLLKLYEWLCSLIEKHGPIASSSSSSSPPLLSVDLTCNAISQEVVAAVAAVCSSSNFTEVLSIPSLQALCTEHLLNADEFCLDEMPSLPTELMLTMRSQMTKCKVCQKFLCRQDPVSVRTVTQNVGSHPMGLTVISSAVCSDQCRKALLPSE
jgi:hypothetical protein